MFPSNTKRNIVEYIRNMSWKIAYMYLFIVNINFYIDVLELV